MDNITLDNKVKLPMNYYPDSLVNQIILNNMKYTIKHRDEFGTVVKTQCQHWKGMAEGIEYTNSEEYNNNDWGFIPHAMIVSVTINDKEETAKNSIDIVTNLKYEADLTKLDETICKLREADNLIESLKIKLNKINL